MFKKPSKNIAKIAIPGVPKNLFYSFQDLELDIDAGWEVEVEVGRRKANGWVVAVLSAEDAISELKKENSTFPKDKEIQFKKILFAEKSFLPQQLNIFKWIAEYYGANLADVLDTALPSLIRKRKVKEKVVSDQINSTLTLDRPLLNAQQQSAVEKINEFIDSKEFNAALLYGVTGSGKTEVYFHAIEKVLNQGGSALLIVPEIALTPQLLMLLEKRFHHTLAILHSQITKSIKTSTWKDLLQGKIRLAVGARSAIFAPLDNLQLIIVDEEHDGSYKQSDGLRYNARDIAVMRAKQENSTVVLGSATPSFESLINAQKGRYKILKLPERATKRPLPLIELIDLNKIKKKEMPSPNISPQLYQAISDTLLAKQQVIILYNKRGFSSFLQCETCNEVVMCPNCSVSMTYYKNKNELLCHYCNFSVSNPLICKFCLDPKTTKAEGEEISEDFGKLVLRGAGTEKVVEELSAFFPEARILRLDRDSTKTVESYSEVLSSMRLGKADILVGTQMIAKGHDLPGVTLVGIIDADLGLHFPDFRSSERTFQLLTQASGRAGRGDEAGKVLIQTKEPNHPTLVATATGRFSAFSRYELDYRKQLFYPPHAKLMRLVISSTDLQEAFNISESLSSNIKSFSSSIKQENDFCSILGPAPAPYQKLKNRYRFHILVKSQSSKTISQIANQLNSWKTSLKKNKNIRLSIDVDPFDML